MLFDKPTRRHFTAAARAAAVEARRRKQESRAAAAGSECPEVFVVRHLGGNLEFRWELRRFGGVVVDRSDAVFLRTSDARAAGDRALLSRLGQVR